MPNFKEVALIDKATKIIKKRWAKETLHVDVGYDEKKAWAEYERDLKEHEEALREYKDEKKAYAARVKKLKKKLEKGEIAYFGYQDVGEEPELPEPPQPPGAVCMLGAVYEAHHALSHKKAWREGVEVSEADVDELLRNKYPCLLKAFEKVMGGEPSEEVPGFNDDDDTSLKDVVEKFREIRKEFLSIAKAQKSQ